MDIRIEKTEKAIRDAFIEQRTRKPLEKIRVKELCEAARINKSTFYAHYQDIYALAEALEKQLIENILARLSSVTLDDLSSRPEWLTQELYLAFGENREMVQALFSGSRQGLLVNHVENGLRRLTNQEEPEHWEDPIHSILLSFCVQGGYYAFSNNSGRIDDETLVRVLGAVAKAAQNIGPELALAERKGAMKTNGKKPPAAGRVPSREQAERILAEAQQRYNEVSEMHGRWADHSRTAARCAERIAARCEGLDPDRAFVLGLLHDIGRCYGDGHLRHVYYGWKYMNELGYDGAAKICLTHSFQIQTMESYIGMRDIPPEALRELEAALLAARYDDYDCLIQLCDSIAGPDGVLDMAERMEDVRRRYGDYPQDKWNRNFELKGYFERWGGMDLYEMTAQEQEG